MTPTPIPPSLAAECAEFDRYRLDAYDQLLHDADASTLRAMLGSATDLCATLARSRDERVAQIDSLTVAHRAELARLRAEIDAAVGQLATLTADRDDARKHLAACERRVTGLEATAAKQVEAHRALTADRDALAARVRELEARPVLTKERLGEAIRGAWIADDSMSRAVAVGDASAIMAQLGAVPLPAQDRAEEIVRKMRSYGWLIDGDGAEWARCEADMARALASLGAPTKTPQPAAVGEPDAAYVERVARAIWCAYNNAEPSGWHNMTIGVRASWMTAARAAITTRASQPAPVAQGEVFVGVSVDDMLNAYVVAAATSKADDDQRCRAGMESVVDRLKVSIVAPVDPEEVVLRYVNEASRLDGSAPSWGAYDQHEKDARIAAMRAALTAAGIPVTPEVVK